jgi:hypothetical protein
VNQPEAVKLRLPAAAPTPETITQDQNQTAMIKIISAQKEGKHDRFSNRCHGIKSRYRQQGRYSLENSR